jgi:hypothetical protein
MKIFRGQVKLPDGSWSLPDEVKEAETLVEAQETIGRRWLDNNPTYLPPPGETGKLTVRVWPKELELCLDDFRLKPSDDIRRIMIHDTAEWMHLAHRRPDANVYRTGFEFRYTGVLDDGAKEVALTYDHAAILVEWGAKYDTAALDHVRRKQRID